MYCVSYIKSRKEADMEKPHRLKKLSQLKGVNFADFDRKLIEVHKEIGILKGACYGLPNPQLLLSPTVLREALASSEIENIITTLADVLQAQLFSEAEQQTADKEVLRYNHALVKGLKMLDGIPIGSKLIKEVHDLLIPDEKGYRRTQNALINDKTREVIYTPPSVAHIPELISDMEHFIHRDPSDIDPILVTIITHYQFEAIHPFGDGNGRTGRILMVLCLTHFKLLDLPVLFISGYINNHKAEYYAAIRKVTEEGDWKNYIDYMLTAFCEQAIESTALLLKIKELHEEVKRKIRNELPKIYSRDLVDAIFNQPFITPTKYGEIRKVTYQTGSSHLKSLEKIGIMQSVKVGKYLFFANVELLDLLRPKQ
jgi:Fic family protein